MPDQLATAIADLRTEGNRLSQTTLGSNRWMGYFVAADFLELKAAAATGVEKPTVTVLCGSTRFYDQFQEANYNLTMAGHIVLSVGFYPHAKAEHGHGEGVGHDSTEKLALDQLHMRKIDLADEVYVLNVDGYIGSSTRAELVYAQQLGRPIRYLEPDSAPVAGDETNGFTFTAFRIPGRPNDALIKIRAGDEVVRDFEHPMYAVWTLLAHWRENLPDLALATEDGSRG